MKILVIGQGGREHTLVWKLAQSDQVSQIFVAPGNGGTVELAESVAIKDTDIDGLVQFAQENKIDLTVVGPENPLIEGVANRFQAEGLNIFGPTQEAALIEGSKSFAKELMKKYAIPTAQHEVFTQYEEAMEYLNGKQAPIVIKADGLAAGKGVTVAQSMEEAKQAVTDILKNDLFGEAGSRVVIEEYLQGEELSLMAFVQGETVVPMLPAQDHKPVYDHDQGPNTGGMGAYSPVPQFNQEQITEVVETILKPTAKAMVKEGRSFSGILYAGLMMTPRGPKVIEFNARFGDPETQVVLPLLRTDLLDIMLAVTEQRLDQIEVEWSNQSVMTIVLASQGYPGSYKKGLPIDGLDAFRQHEDLILFHAGTKVQEGQVQTSGGRVLAVTAISDTIHSAREKGYAAIKSVSFHGRHYRKDIGQKAIQNSTL